MKIRLTAIRSAPVENPGVATRRVQWVWACPGCGKEEKAFVDEQATRAEIAADASCWDCRKREA